MLTIKVLGTGCPNCRKLEETVKKALNEINLQADIVLVKDVNEIVSHGVILTPGLIINDKLKCSGRVPKLDEVKEWILEEKQEV
ncbi:MAG: thioredoxin family protein [Actinobacteria bacterium]|nr:thioredoxin family protein [Actinomycetota bacterium]